MHLAMENITAIFLYGTFEDRKLIGLARTLTGTAIMKLKE